MLYPIGIQNFEKIRTDGYVYVDKTARIHEIVTNGCYYSLNRPKGFGKTLLLSNLGSIFQRKTRTFQRIGNRATGNEMGKLSYIVA